MVLGQPLLANLAITKQVLDDMKRLLDLGSNTGFGLFEGHHQHFLSAVSHFLNRASSVQGHSTESQDPSYLHPDIS